MSFSSNSTSFNLGYVSSAVAYILGLVEMCEVEGVELYWTWIGKIMALVC